MSSDNKNDLTRIEDLGEFIHELNSEDESNSFSDDISNFPQETESSFEGTDFTGTQIEDSTEIESFESHDSSASDSLENSEISSTQEDPFSSTSDFESSSFEEESSFETEDQSEKIEDESWKTDISSKAQAEEEIPQISFEASPSEEKAPLYEPSTEFKAPENFEDLKKFSESSSFTGIATEGNPSYSVLVKNIRYIEDVTDIIGLLKELDLLVDSEEQTKARLMRGNLLIPRISEYAAIFVAHKLRRFDVDLLIGHSDEIHPPKHQETPETGIVSKHSLYQNQTHHFHFDDPKFELSQIIVAATPTLEGYQVIRYMGVASEHKMLESHLVEDEYSSEIPSHYQELAQKLKAHALKNKSNAVVGLNYQLTPLPSELGTGGLKYRLTCTGNLVWVNKL